MILYALMYCMGISMHLSQVYTHAEPELSENCEVVYYVAADADNFYNHSKYDHNYLATLDFEYPLYMGPICMDQDNNLIYYHIPPEVVFQHNGLKWELNDIIERGYFSFSSPLLGEPYPPSMEIPGAVAVLEVHDFKYEKSHPRYLEAFKKYLREKGFLIIREETSAYPDILWRPTFKPGVTYNPYGPEEEIPNYFRMEDPSELIVRDW